VVGCVRACSILIIAVSMILSGWLCYKVGWVICVWRTYKQFTQSVKIYAGSSTYFVVSSLSVLYMAVSSARKIV